MKTVEQLNTNYSSKEQAERMGNLECAKLSKRLGTKVEVVRIDEVKIETMAKDWTTESLKDWEYKSIKRTSFRVVIAY
jgi:hypothetical protein